MQKITSSVNPPFTTAEVLQRMRADTRKDSVHTQPFLAADLDFCRLAILCEICQYPKAMSGLKEVHFILLSHELLK